MQSPHEFVQGAKELVRQATAYNCQAGPDQAALIDVAMLPVPRDAYCTTSSHYLRFNAGRVNVFYSPVFQVPVLYLAPLDGIEAEVTGQAGVDALMTATEHPITGLPTRYLHPCQTALVMSELQPQSPRDYLSKWIGSHQALLPRPHRASLVPAAFFSHHN